MSPIDMAKRLISWARAHIRIKLDPIGYAKDLGVSVGDDCKFGDIDRGTFGTEPQLIEIGDHVELTSDVRFITHDGAVWVFRAKEPQIDVFGRIVIGTNVFVGMRTLILPGVTIGNNVVIGAGSVVTSDIPDNTVAAGVPARPLSDLQSYRDKIEPLTTHIRDWDIERKIKYLKQRLPQNKNSMFESQPNNQQRS